MAGSEREPHEYEPGDVHHPMHTEPTCVVCGNPQNFWLHEPERVNAWERRKANEARGKRGG